MPKALFESVYAVSSEDSNYPASSLLKMQSGKKWRTKDCGEKSAFAVLKLAGSQQITGIDLGNEHSAFIEVLVGKNGCGPDEFKEILITSSFMTPFESRGSTNVNRVRCFAKNALVETIANEKWDLVKIICTQPFNQHVQYGVSFITVHIAQDAESKQTEQKSLIPESFLRPNNSSQGNSSAKPGLAGKFKLREDSPDSESESSIGLFSRWKLSKTQREKDDTMSTAAVIRAASSPSALRKQSESLKPLKLAKPSTKTRDDNDENHLVLDRNRNDLLFDVEDETPNEKLEMKISADQNRVRKAYEDEKQKKHKGGDRRSSLDRGKKDKKGTSFESKPPTKRPVASTSQATTTATSSSLTESTIKKRPSTSTSTQLSKKPKSESELQYKPFNQLMSGVALVISGIQNPDRAKLRSQAIAMGAKYKADWDSSCTHLICAFKNTPKYNQVHGKGKIVTRKWIEKCYDAKKRFPWRRFALDEAEKDLPESEDEILDESMKSKELASKSPTKSKPPPKSEGKCLLRRNESNDTITYYDLGGDVDVRTDLPSSGSDTDDEILKVRNRQQKDVQIDDVFDVSTEEEDHTKARRKKDIFRNKKFFISSNISVVDNVKLEQYIGMFKGELTKTLLSADFVISNESIPVPMSFRGEIVRPLWVYECHDMECLIPTKRYLVPTE